MPGWTAARCRWSSTPAAATRGSTSIPVIVYARECAVSEDLLFRALVISNLVTIHLKTGIGSLSAYCGATSAGAGAGAGICYLYGGSYEEIAQTIVNALAINSGMICDGAKASCAAKIASAVEAGLLGMCMNMHDSQFFGGCPRRYARHRQGSHQTDDVNNLTVLSDPQTGPGPQWSGA